MPLAQTGTAFAVGGGSEAPRRAKALAELGYRTALFADSDKPLDPVVPNLERSGVRVIQWADRVSTEERVAFDLPWAAIQDLVSLMIELNGEDSTLAATRKALLGAGEAVAGTTVEDLRSDILGEEKIRHAVAAAAKETKVFKQVDTGEQLGNLVGRFLPAIPGSDLSVKLAQIATWCYGE